MERARCQAGKNIRCVHRGHEEVRNADDDLCRLLRRDGQHGGHCGQRTQVGGSVSKSRKPKSSPGESLGSVPSSGRAENDGGRVSSRVEPPTTLERTASLHASCSAAKPVDFWTVLAQKGFGSPETPVGLRTVPESVGEGTDRRGISDRWRGAHGRWRACRCNFRVTPHCRRTMQGQPACAERCLCEGQPRLATIPPVNQALRRRYPVISGQFTGVSVTPLLHGRHCTNEKGLTTNRRKSFSRKKYRRWELNPHCLTATGF